MWYKISNGYMWVREPKIPAEYQEVEYIQSSWTSCWINTWITPHDTSFFEIEFKMNPTTLKSSGNYFYWTNSSWAWNSFEYTSSSSSYWNVWSSTLIWTLSPNLSTWTDYIFDCKYSWNNWWTLTVSWTYSKSVSYSWSTWTKPLYFFCWWDDLSVQSAEKLYYLKIYTWASEANKTLVRDLVPCYRKSDNAIWLYDLVNDQFYTNAWSWTFTKGNNVEPTYVFKEKQFYPGAWPTPSALFEIETDFRNYSNISDVYALWWWAQAKWSMQPTVNTTYWFYCGNYTSYWWWQWLYYDISSYMANAKKIYAHLTWYMPWWYTYQANERIVLCNISRIDGNWETTASDQFTTELKWWNYNNNTNIGKAVGWASYTKLVDYWSSNYTWDVDITFEINLESWLVTSTITQPSSISMQYTLSASEISRIKSTLKFIDFAFTTYATWINNYIKTAHIKIE